MLLVISNNFSRGVVEEYLKYFNFERDMLDVALRKFLAQFLSTSETQERKRVLVFFSKRCIDCNPGSFNSQSNSYYVVIINSFFMFSTNSIKKTPFGSRNGSRFLPHTQNNNENSTKGITHT
ncbi:PH and SEC7 domain-containing protein-like isoform X1 [Cotesia typhae]|uniref:PH and SEC7 domain-containing protein-like isoform X1 n=1 Tax=Cotesia typhae TaxID=2053667 RepID=UPI003D68CE44